MSDNDFSNDSMLELYLFESNTLLDQLDEILLQAESDNELKNEDINEIFRIMHTIKGSSAMMTFNVISGISHKVEDLFSMIRDNDIPNDAIMNTMDLLLNVSDFLKSEVKKIQDGEDLTESAPQLESELASQFNNFEQYVTDEKKPPDVGRMLGGMPASAEKPKENKPEIKQPEPVSAKVIDNTPVEDKPIADTPIDDKPVEGKVLGDEPNEEKTYYLHVYFNEGSKMENIRAFMLTSKLKEMGTVNRTIPQVLEGNDDASDYIIENGFYCSFTTTLSREEIESAAKGTLSVETVSFVKKLPGVAEEDEKASDNNDSNIPSDATAEKDNDNPPSDSNLGQDSVDTNADKIENPESKSADVIEATIPEKKNRPTKQNLISVDLTKLDSLMDLVGEIVITESMVIENPAIQDLELESFQKASRQLNKLTDELQDIVMSVRLVPVSSIFQKMRRIVRDMSKNLGKETELVLIGENTEVDKTILDAIGDPIMHLVRNAMDHAIETREERIAANKNPVGNIILSAQNMGGDIIISVSDDGRGLDKDKILEKAEKNNLLKKPISEYSDKEIYNLLMSPGFSTKSEVSEYSGRGVGMDVVKMNIEKIGGTVIIESVKGVGTNIFLKIPLTLAIISCMEVNVGNMVCSIPITNIKESFKATGRNLLRDPDGKEMIMLRGECYPIVRLHELFDEETAEKNIEDAILILVDSGEKVACLMVDELVDKSQVVIKPMPQYLNRFKVKRAGISGCTIMGNGKISLILDVLEILS